MGRLLLLGVVLADTAPAPDNTVALYGLIGVIAAALLSTFGAIFVGYLGKKRDRPLDASPNDVSVLVSAYKDARHDLEKANKRIVMLEAEVDENRALMEHYMNELAIDRTRSRPRKATT